MEIKEMKMSDIEARKLEIAELIKNEDADLDAFNKEVDELNERAKALKDELEQRNALIDKVSMGEVGETLEVRKETIEMEKNYTIDSMEYRNAWLKTLKGDELDEVEKRAYATTDTYNAIPTLVADKFVEKMKKLAPMLDEITLFRVGGNLKITTEGTNNAAAVHTENSAITPSADTIVTVELGAYEYAKVITISKSVKAMSIDAFEGWIVDMLGRDIARALDNHIINHSTNGIANGTYTTTGTGANEIIATTNYTYNDICDLIALLPSGYDANAKFLVNKKTLWGDIKGMTDNSGRPIFDATSTTLCGYPVLVDDYVSTTDKGIYFADFREAVIGNLSVPVEVESSEAAGFMSGSIAYRGFASFDSKPTGAPIVRMIYSA